MINSHICCWTSWFHACCTSAGGRDACLGASSKTTDSTSAGSGRSQSTYGCILLKRDFNQYQVECDAERWVSVKLGGSVTLSTAPATDISWCEASVVCVLSFWTSGLWTTADDIGLQGNSSLDVFTISAAVIWLGLSRENMASWESEYIPSSIVIIHEFSEAAL